MLRRAPGGHQSRYEHHPHPTPANEEEPHQPLDHQLVCEFGQPVRRASAASPGFPGPLLSSPLHIEPFSLSSQTWLQLPSV